jgi:hypothetical protein
MNRSKNQMKIQYEQEDYDGNIKIFSIKFNSIDEFQSWKKNMKRSANYIGKHFKILETN